MRCLIALAICSVAFALPDAPLSAHPGGVNSEGCHNNRKTGDYHCHGQRKPRTRQPNSTGAVYYPNCDAVREAGHAPLRRGDPGYRSGLDRDGDGVACEYSRYNPR